MMTGPNERLVALLKHELARLFPDGGPDPIAAATLAVAIAREGWRQITPEIVEAAMEAVPNLGVEAYEPTVSQLTAALLGEVRDDRT